MSIFAQVWLWSVASFLIGMLLTWLVLVRPAQARNRILERRLSAAQQAASAPERLTAPPTRTFEPDLGPGERYQPEPALLSGQPESFDRFRPEPDPFAESEAEPFDPFPPGEPISLSAEPEPLKPLDHFPPDPEPADASREEGWLERESFGEPVRDDEVEKVTLAPATEFAGLSSVLEPERETAVETTSIFKPVDEYPIADKGSERGSLFDGPTDAPEPDFDAFSQREPEPELPTYAFAGEDAPAADESAIETTQVLPRRQRRQPQREGGETPYPVQPSMRSIERREPVQPDEGGRSGSLFEPAVRRNSEGAQATPADPAPARQNADSSVPPGPFGPGSAMPRPGGGRPSDEFTVKASVTALRYCTDDSPQYARMIAEVWFRTTADAERVGFRPLT